MLQGSTSPFSSFPAPPEKHEDFSKTFHIQKARPFCLRRNTSFRRNWRNIRCSGGGENPWHPSKLTWNLKIIQLNRNIIFQASICWVFSPWVFAVGWDGAECQQSHGHTWPGGTTSGTVGCNTHASLKLTLLMKISLSKKKESSLPSTNLQARKC